MLILSLLEKNFYSVNFTYLWLLLLRIILATLTKVRRIQSAAFRERTTAIDMFRTKSPLSFFARERKKSSHVRAHRAETLLRGFVQALR